MRILLLFLLTFNLYAATSIKSGKGIRLYKNDNAFYTELKASANTSATVTYSLPNADGINGQVLMTNGTGSLTWSNIPTGTASYATEWTAYTPVYTGFGTVSNSEMYWRKEGSDIWIRGRFTAGTTTSVEARMSLPIVSGATLTTSSSVGALTIGGFAGRSDNTSTFYAVNYEASKQYVNFGCGINSTCSFGNKNNGDVLLSAGQELIIQPTKININGWDNVVRAVVGQVAYLKDIKYAGENGGTFTSGAWQTRTLNTVEGDSSIVSLSSNQITLQAGTYDLEAEAPAFAVNFHKSKLRNITDGTDVAIGSNEKSDATDNVVSKSSIKTRFTITAQKTFEIQHYCTSTLATIGFGYQMNIGVKEVYTQVKITKVQ